MTQWAAQKEGGGHRRDTAAAAGDVAGSGGDGREMVWLVPTSHPPVTHQLLPTAKTPRSWWVKEPQKCKGKEGIREQTCSELKCPRKAGLARPHNANLILSAGCKGFPRLNQVIPLRSLLALP